MNKLDLLTRSSLKFSGVCALGFALAISQAGCSPSFRSALPAVTGQSQNPSNTGNRDTPLPTPQQGSGAGTPPTNSGGAAATATPGNAPTATPASVPGSAPTPTPAAAPTATPGAPTPVPANSGGDISDPGHPPVGSGVQLFIDARYFNPEIPDASRWQAWSGSSTESLTIGKDKVGTLTPLQMPIWFVNGTSAAISLVVSTSTGVVVDQSVVHVPAQSAAALQVSLDTKTAGSPAGVVSLTYGGQTLRVNVNGTVSEVQ